MTMSVFTVSSEAIGGMIVSLDMNDMRDMQQALQARYAGWWEPVDPEHGKNKLLWMLAELGEAIQVVKRNPADDIAKPGAIRNEFVEEMADVLMYFNNVLLCYGITPAEFEEIYRVKHERNLNRWKKPEA